MPWGSETHARPKGHHYRSRPLGQEDETSQMSCCFAPDLSAGVCVKRYGPRLPIKHDYFDKDLSRKGAAPATGRDTLIKLQGRVARKLDTHASENRLAGLPTRITRITRRGAPPGPWSRPLRSRYARYTTLEAGVPGEKIIGF